MTAKPWGECPLCHGVGYAERYDGASLYRLACPCAAARRAAFEEALAAKVQSMPLDVHSLNLYLQGIAAKNAAIRAKMEGEK